MITTYANLFVFLQAAKRKPEEPLPEAAAAPVQNGAAEKGDGELEALRQQRDLLKKMIAQQAQVSHKFHSLNPKTSSSSFPLCKVRKRPLIENKTPSYKIWRMREATRLD